MPRQYDIYIPSEYLLRKPFRIPSAFDLRKALQAANALSDFETSEYPLNTLYKYPPRKPF